MPLYSIDDKAPQLNGEGHFIAPNASIVGDVVLEQACSVWFNAVIRAENDRVHIGARSNIQDAAVLHVDPGFPLVIGENVTVGHKAMLHGCTVGSGSLIGINAVVLNGAVIGKGCLIGANALVTEGMIVADGSLVLGSPGKIVKTLSAEAQQKLLVSAQSYVNNAQRFTQTFVEKRGQI